ncbi:MAG: DUF924 domain-containing protein [Alphaproteobacteria bacterium]|nr:MAG: DUF924 domain-containing protein [Alphaproteobacteria bacterium]
MPDVEEVLHFWLDEVGPKGWYAVDEKLDREIRERFQKLWEEAAAGKHHEWQAEPRGALAYIILTDQFPRNMFRGDARAFQTDKLARKAAKHAIDLGWDKRIPEPARQFFYLPLMHSESLCDQDRAVRLFLTRMPETGEANLLHAKAHREIIRKFGRFPYRNAALHRQTTEDERHFLEDEGGYGGTVEAIRKAANG